MGPKMESNNLERWHRALLEQDHDLLREILDDDVELHSPTVGTPKLGKDLVHFILTTVFDVFDDFTYHREWIDSDDMALEFSAKVGDRNVKGVDLIKWNQEGKIIHFEVAMRPLRGVQALFEEMNSRFEKAGLA
jgi:hypothetical protein